MENINKFEQIVSKVGARAMEFVFEEKPSDLVPFDGTFPIVPAYEKDKFIEEIEQHRYISECEDWVQAAIYKGDEMYRIHYGFSKWLSKSGVGEDNFMTMDNSDKATELVRYLNANSMTLENLHFD